MRVSSGHDPAHLAGVDRVAITPALRAHPGPRRARRCRGRGPPGRPMAGAARRADGGSGATSAWRSPARTASRPRPRCLATCSIDAGLDPTVEVGALHRRMGCHGAPRRGSAFPGRGGRVRRQLPELPPRGGDRHQRRDGPSRLLRRSRARCSPISSASCAAWRRTRGSAAASCSQPRDDPGVGCARGSSRRLGRACLTLRPRRRA